MLARQGSRAKRRHHRIEFPQSRDTSDFDIPSRPNALTRSSTLLSSAHTPPARPRAMHAPPAGVAAGARGIGPRAHLGNGQLDRPHPRIPRAQPAPVAVRAPLAGTFWRCWCGLLQPASATRETAANARAEQFAQRIRGAGTSAQLSAIVQAGAAVIRPRSSCWTLRGRPCPSDEFPEVGVPKKSPLRE